MSHLFICIATLLISLTAGMFLLAQTKKDNLGTFHNVISWFVIILSLSAILFCGIRAAAGGGRGMYKQKEIIIENHGNGEEMMMKKGRGHKMFKKNMQGDCCDMMAKDDCCEKMKEGACIDWEEKADNENCCKKKNVTCIKDTVVVRKTK